MFSEAAARGATPIVIYLAPVSIAEMQKDFSAVKRAMNLKSNAVLAELGADAWQAARWESGMGHMGIYVTSTGLTRLQQSGLAISFRPDKSWIEQTHLAIAEGNLNEIERQLSQNDAVDVVVTLNVDGLDFDLLSDGNLAFKESADARADLKSKAVSVLNVLTTADAVNKEIAFQVSNEIASGKRAFDPQITIRVNRQGLLKLASSESVRGLRPVNYSRKQSLHVEKGLLEEMQQSAKTRVLFSVLTPLGSGKLSASSTKKMVASHQRTLSDVVAKSGIEATWTQIPEFGVAAADLTASDVQKLINSRDDRIRGIFLNKILAESMLERSTASTATNMPKAWNNVPPLIASGQTVIVMDGGIQKSHPFFRKSATDATSRVTFEACFGTNNTEYESLCSNANSLGDSPPGQLGSGEPYEGNSCGAGDGCSHGTHVAGIAAGKWLPGMPQTRQGVAHGASIASINVYSYKRKATPTTPRSGSLGVYTEDFLLALQLLGNSLVPSYFNPWVINMSFGSKELYYGQFACSSDGVFGTTPEYVGLVQSAVDKLYSRGVPIVAAVGNNSQYAATFPACLKNVVKVASVTNGPSPVLSSFTNITDPAVWGTDAYFLAPGGETSGIGASNTIFSAGINANSSLPLSDSAWWRGLSGTSMAAPHVAGLLAIVKAAAPGCTVKFATDWIRDNGSIPVTYDIQAGIPGAPLFKTFRLIRL